MENLHDALLPETALAVEERIMVSAEKGVCGLADDGVILFRGKRPD